MDEPANAHPCDSILDQWEHLSSRQATLFKQTAEANRTLEDRVTELEKELGVWKLAYDSAQTDSVNLKAQVGRLQRNIGSWKDDNPLVIVLIDGDGHIFHQDLIQQGQAGGRAAAGKLKRGIITHLDSLADDLPTSSTTTGRSQVWVSIYCNISGLVDVLVGQGICTPDTFQSFCVGFNQASPLFSIVDAGSGKEAADTKIKECLRVFTKYPQTTHVFFGGSHDNGYTSTLTSLETEGLLTKITLLKGYKDLATEIRSLGLPQFDIPGLFATHKFPTSRSTPRLGSSSSLNPRLGSSSTTSRPGPTTSRSGSTTTQPLGKQHSKSSSSSASSSTTTTTAKANYLNNLLQDGNDKAPVIKVVDKTQSVLKLKPPPCVRHYIEDRKCTKSCRFSHAYILFPQHIQDLRDNARLTPCPSANRECSLIEFLRDFRFCSTLDTSLIFFLFRIRSCFDLLPSSTAFLLRPPFSVGLRSPLTSEFLEPLLFDLCLPSISVIL
ncbi:hypothetical protein BDV98DRAFT_195913 [Pterulicium gracile]|uniref:DUF7923 domain-containing protein n=1 Tax=Pterulicium gracile TaxID=1884261 RepID=A0A5C3QFD0_9AGAR|nr:hypothetical protein BDV98DRAFT_195913 [Pterula gracilis]